ncbi:MAG: hypothetical protein U5K77_00345 [Candidatus Saccharibacteria bacterium]|nr:hypothetical protein [Candidatus Saccharibacteria bacterium]
MMRNNQQGFSAIAIIAILVVVAVVAFAGWRVYDAQENGTESTPEVTSQERTPAPEVSDSQDLEEAESYLKDIDVDSELDTSEIDEALNE